MTVNPLYTLYRLYKSYRTCGDNEEMPYDREQGFWYYGLVPGRWYRRACAVVALMALLVWAEVWCAYQGLLPPNRGDITRAELVTMAFIGTSGSGYQMGQSVLWRELSQAGQWDGAPVSAGGFTRTATLEQEGYYDDFGHSTGMLAPLPEAESGWYRFTVRVERTAK